MNVSPLRKRPALSFVRKTDKDGDGRYAEAERSRLRS